MDVLIKKIGKNKRLDPGNPCGMLLFLSKERRPVKRSPCKACVKFEMDVYVLKMCVEYSIHYLCGQDSHIVQHNVHSINIRIICHSDSERI